MRMDEGSAIIELWVRLTVRPYTDTLLIMSSVSLSRSAPNACARTVEFFVDMSRSAPLLVLALTHSPLQAGLLGALRAIPFTLLTVPAGAPRPSWSTPSRTRPRSSH